MRYRPLQGLEERENRPLDLVVHVEFHRMWVEFIAHVLFHLQLNISIDLVVIEHAALGKECTVCVERCKRFSQ